MGRLDLTGGEIQRLASDQAAVRLLHHRGPDDEGTWYGRRVFLGMRRLSVIDLATGHQPIGNEDGTIQVVYNGEIYNFQDVRTELEARGHHFATLGDTEVIVHGYEEWGEAVLDRLNGMFALALWDGRTETLWVARDRLGVKPLYYVQAGDQLLFASEIKALLAHSMVERQINPHGLLTYLAYGHSIAPDTMYRGIHKLPPGHSLLARGSSFRVRTWWNPVPGEPARVDAEQCAREVRRLLDDSVRLRMIADVPVGAFLSGGLDSSAVVALMTRHATGPVKTFSIGFAGGAEYNELADARRVAAHLGTDHHELQVESHQLVETVQKLVYHFDEPFGDAACFPTYLVSQLARSHVTVALTGEGGDELFGGYRRYWFTRWIRRFRTATAGAGGRAIGPLIDQLPRFRRLKKAAEASAIADPAARYASLLRVFGDEDLRSVVNSQLRPAIDSFDPVEPYRRHFVAAADADELNRLMYVDLKTWLPDTYLEKVDKTSMAVSLEARVPLLDYRLVEFALSIPSALKISRTDTKRVLRDAVRDLLPAETMHKPKHGFAVPTDPWFKTDLKAFAYDVLLDPRTRHRGYINTAAVERLWREHQEGRHVRDAHLWTLMNLELWAREYLDRQVAA